MRIWNETLVMSPRCITWLIGGLACGWLNSSCHSHQWHPIELNGPITLNAYIRCRLITESGRIPYFSLTHTMSLWDAFLMIYCAVTVYYIYQRSRSNRTWGKWKSKESSSAMYWIRSSVSGIPRMGPQGRAVNFWFIMRARVPGVSTRIGLWVGFLFQPTRIGFHHAGFIRTFMQGFYRKQ